MTARLISLEKTMLRYVTVFALSLISGAAYAAELDTIKCVEKADAEEIVARILATPSLQSGADPDAFLQKVNHLVDGGKCELVHLDPADAVVVTATAEHPEGGVRLGVVALDHGYAVAFDFTTDLF